MRATVEQKTADRTCDTPTRIVTHEYEETVVQRQIWTRETTPILGTEATQMEHVSTLHCSSSDSNTGGKVGPT